MTNPTALLSLWPYYILSIALIIALVAFAVIRKRLRDRIAVLDRWLNEAAGLRVHHENIINRCSKRLDVIQQILYLVHPYTRLIINNPAKLEAWLQTLKKPKGKKKKKTTR